MSKKETEKKIREQIIIEKCFGSLEIISDFIRERCTEVRLGFKKTWEMMLAVDEVCSNIVMSSPVEEDDDVLKVVFKSNGGTVEVEILDKGHPFNPFQPLKEDDIDDDVDTALIPDPYIVEKMIDEHDYRRRGDFNEVYLKKYRRKRSRKKHDSANS